VEEENLKKKVFLINRREYLREVVRIRLNLFRKKSIMAER